MKFIKNQIPLSSTTKPMLYRPIPVPSPDPSFTYISDMRPQHKLIKTIFYTPRRDLWYRCGLPGSIWAQLRRTSQLQLWDAPLQTSLHNISPPNEGRQKLNSLVSADWRSNFECRPLIIRTSLLRWSRACTTDPLWSCINFVMTT